jgi:hypothetical protein
VRDEEDVKFIEANSPDLPVIGHLDDDPRVRQADREGIAVYHLSPGLAGSARSIVDALG